MLRFIRGLLLRIRRRRKFTALEYIDDKLTVMRSNTIYVLGDPYPWSILMVCPCGCGDYIELNLIEELSPSWRYNIHPTGMVSIYPSVWHLEKCGAHFSVKEGMIHWHA